MGIFDGKDHQWIEISLAKLKEEIEAEIAGGVMDKLLFLLLNAMSLLFVINKEFRKNIKDFKGSYVIRSEDKTIDVSAVFKKVRVLLNEIDGMEVKDHAIENPTIQVTFKNGKAMADFLLSGKPDVIVGMLDNQLSVSGNLNYLFKFVYMVLLIPELLGIKDFQKLVTKSLAAA